VPNGTFYVIPRFVRSLHQPLPCGHDIFVTYEKRIIWAPRHLEVKTGVKTSLFIVPIPLLSGHRLEYEDVYKAKKKSNPVDTKYAT